ncbi:MAG: hypothetical protein JW829_17515 [Pirellulales bacterium]|nr:hypothetical protein [Pirellulales bacterium]
MTSPNKRKVVVVGVGSVGSTFAYALSQSGLTDEIVLIDKNEALVCGQVLDLAHGQPFFPAVEIRQGNAADYRDAQVIVITAGAAQQPGETRLQLLQKNAGIVRSIVDEVINENHCGVMLIVTNSAYHIIGYKGATCFAVCLALVRITRAILRGENSVLTVSTRLKGEFGFQNICLSVPCLVSRRGVERIIASNLGQGEMAALSASAAVLKQVIGQLESNS